MNDAMIRECKLHGYTGFQFDFENIDWTDRDLLTAVVKTSAEALHTAGLQLSIATVPNAPGLSRRRAGLPSGFTPTGAAPTTSEHRQICRPCLPDDLRPAHPLDDARPSRRLAMDDRQPRLRLEIGAQGKALARHSALRLSLVYRRPHERRNYRR